MPHELSIDQLLVVRAAFFLPVLAPAPSSLVPLVLSLVFPALRGSHLSTLYSSSPFATIQVLQTLIAIDPFSVLLGYLQLLISSDFACFLHHKGEEGILCDPPG